MEAHDDESPLESLDRFVVENDDLSELEGRIGRFNIFDALRIADVEIRHSNYLSWLIDPAETHAQGAVFLKAVLMDLLRQSPPDLRPLSAAELDGEDLRGVEVRREWRNIDILITCEQPSFVIAVENKIKSGEHGRQLEIYEATIAQQFPGTPAMFVFLTVDGDEPSRSKWVPYTYADIFDVLTRAKRSYENAIGDDVIAFLDHYLRLIGSRFMDDVELDELCRRIYRNHRQALDLIFERVGLGTGQVMSRVHELLESDSRWQIVQQSKTRVRFIPKEWEKLLPPLGKEKHFGVTKWINFVIRMHPTKATFFLTVRPAVDDKVRDRVIECITRNGFKTFFKNKEHIGARYANLGREVLVSWNEEDELDIDKVELVVRTKLDKLAGQVEVLSKAIEEVLPKTA